MISRILSLVCASMMIQAAYAKDYGQDGKTFHLMPPSWSVSSAQKKQETRKQRALNWYHEHYDNRKSNKELRAKMKADLAASKAGK